MANGIGQQNNPLYGAPKGMLPQGADAKLPYGGQYSIKEAKQDVKNTAENSWFGNIFKGFGMEGMTPQKALACLAGSLAIVFGGSWAMNTFVKKGGMFKMGDMLDKFSKKTGLGEFGKKVADKMTPATDWLKKTKIGQLFSKNNKGLLLHPKSAMAQLTLKGTYGEAVDEITDCLQTMVKNGGDDLAKLKNVISAAGGDEKQLLKLIEKYNTEGGKNPLIKFEVYEKFKNPLKKYFGFDKQGQELIDFLKKGDVKELKQKISVMGLKHNVNIGEAVKKVMILEGEGAQTGLGKAMQKISLRGVEAVTNGVTSRAKFGLGIAVPIYFGIMNKVFNAPKKEKGKTLADEMVQDMGGYMMMPVAGGALYGGLSALKYAGAKPEAIKTFKDGLKNLGETFAQNKDKAAWKEGFKKLKSSFAKDQSFIGKILSAPGKALSIGLEGKPWGKLKGVGGGVLRFAAFMWVSSLLVKPVIGLSRKIFGKTTAVKEEEAKAKAEKEARKNPQAGLDMTQEQLIQKLSERPELMARLQNDPKLLEEIQKDPAKLIQLLNETPATAPAPAPAAPNNQIPQGAMSPALREKLGQTGAVQPAPSVQAPVQQPAAAPQSPMPQSQIMQNDNTIPQAQAPAAQGTQEPQRSYIPSSKPVAVSDTTATPEQQSKLQDAFSRADKAEAEAMKFLS